VFYLSEPGIHCALGTSTGALREKLVLDGRPIPEPAEIFQLRGGRSVASVQDALPPLPAELNHYDCRNNRLAASALKQLKPAVDSAIKRYGSSRVAVVMGTSTSGIAETECAVRSLQSQDQYPEGYHAIQGVLGGLSDFVCSFLNTSGPAYTLSTACASSASALLSARRLLNLGLSDAVVVGGVDSLCEMTLQGFGALEALAGEYSKPFCTDRDGINLGEAAAVFLMSREPGEVAFLGGAASSDAHHISAPHPEGAGAYQAMSDALADAGLNAGCIDYLNLHGTGTVQNDNMESHAVNRLFGDQLPCSSSKSMTGHTLGASGALELAICWLLLTQDSDWRLPPSLYSHQKDNALAPIRLTEGAESGLSRPQYCLSNSFAFGGSNVSLVIGRADA
jgi:3-oxoacyl-[acyl-carrier-protein] synthase-1